MPLIRVLVLVLALGQATGISDFMDTACTEDCGDRDCDDGGCPPICPSCHCVMRVPVHAAGSVATIDPLRSAASIAVFFTPGEVLSSPDPREIFHVPIPRIA